MKIVYVLSGPRGSGKSTYARTLLKAHPNLCYLSRDELSMKLFKSTSHNPYTGDGEYVTSVLFEKAEKILKRKGDVLLLFDCFNGYASNREWFIKQFDKFGADKVVCLYLITPLETCVKWFFQKKKAERRGYSENMIIHDYKFFHKKALNDLDYNPTEDEYADIRDTLNHFPMKFDAIRRINPCQLTFPGFPMI